MTCERQEEKQKPYLRSAHVDSAMAMRHDSVTDREGEGGADDGIIIFIAIILIFIVNVSSLLSIMFIITLYVYHCAYSLACSAKRYSMVHIHPIHIQVQPNVMITMLTRH